MKVDPLALERAPRSRVMEWIYFAAEWNSYETYRAEEAQMRARMAAAGAGMPIGGPH